MNIEDWKSQMKRGTLEYCVLIIFSQGDRYGYEIMNELSNYSIITTKESTMYPLLRRLEKENFLRSYWQETNEGLPPRKYYSLTKEGEEYTQLISQEWDNLISAIDKLKGV